MKTSFISFFKSVDLAHRKIPMITHSSGSSASGGGPVVWVVAAIHGDEVTSTETVLRLNRFLKRNPPQKGTIYTIPVLNPLGYEMMTRNEPIESADMNRCFPGHPRGTAPERIAHKIYTEIVDTKPTLVIDLHTDTMRSIPYLYLDQVLNPADNQIVGKLQDYAKIAGVNAFVENIDSYKDLENSITGALVNQGKIPALTVELGGPLIVSEKFVEVGLNVIKNFLAYLGLIAPPTGGAGPRWVYPYKLQLQGIYETVWHKYSPDYSGIVDFRVQPGDLVKKGQPLARIKNLFDKTLQIIYAQEDSVIVSCVDQSIIFPGTELLMAARRNDRAFIAQRNI